MAPFSLVLLYSILAAVYAFSGAHAAPSKRNKGGMFGNSNFVPPPYVAGARWNNTAVSSVDGVSVAAAATAPFWVVYSDSWRSGQHGPPATSDVNVSQVSALPHYM
jgi:hypothetical protein